MAINGLGEKVGSVSGGCITDGMILRICEAGVQAAFVSNTPAVMHYGISADAAHRFGLPLWRHRSTGARTDGGVWLAQRTAARLGVVAQ